MNSIAFDQTKLQRVVSMTLRSGVTTASIIGISGGLLYLAGHGGQHVSFGLFEGSHSSFTSLAATLHALKSEDHSLRDLAIAQVGILILLLTPILRVALSIFGFMLEKDRAYVAITSIVLATLMISVLLH